MILRILFILISTVGVVGALGTVLTRNLVHAALYLVAFFFVIACHFLLLEADFLAAIQVLVYIGAVVILLLFGIMLTRNIQGDDTTGGSWLGKLPAAFVAAGVLALLIQGIGNQKGIGGRPSWSDLRTRVAVSPEITAGEDPRAEVVRSGMASAVGIEMMTRFVIPFEVAGLLLTAAVIGAVALAYSEEETLPKPGHGPSWSHRVESPEPPTPNGPLAVEPEPMMSLTE